MARLMGEPEEPRVEFDGVDLSNYLAEEGSFNFEDIPLDGAEPWGPSESASDKGWEVLRDAFPGVVHGHYFPLAYNGEIQLIRSPRHWWSLKREVVAYPIIVTNHESSVDGTKINFVTTGGAPVMRKVWRWKLRG